MEKDILKRASSIKRKSRSLYCIRGVTEVERQRNDRQRIYEDTGRMHATSMLGDLSIERRQKRCFRRMVLFEHQKLSCTYREWIRCNLELLAGKIAKTTRWKNKKIESTDKSQAPNKEIVLNSDILTLSFTSSSSVLPFSCPI